MSSRTRSGWKDRAGFAAVWPTVKDEAGFAERMNSLPKYVASRSLKSATWNNSTIIGWDLAGEVKALKAQAGGDMLIYGSASIVHALMPQGLVDEYRLMIYPIVLGRGEKLFPQGTQSVMTLAECRTFNDGIVLLRYVI